MKENAAANSISDFKIDEIVTLNKTPNPPSRSWKVRVPKRCENWMLEPKCYPEGWRFRKFDFHGPKRRAQATGQEDPVLRLAPRAVVTAAEEESMPGSSTTTEGTETTEVMATTGTGESATDSVMTTETSW